MQQELSEILGNYDYVDDEVVFVTPVDFSASGRIPIRWAVFTKQGKILNVIYDSQAPGPGVSYRVTETAVNPWPK